MHSGNASLVIQTAFLGDVILTTPLIARLAHDGPVDVVTTPGGKAVLANNRDIRDVYVYDKHDRHRGIGGFLHVVGWLRKRRYKRAVHAQGSVRSAMLSILTGTRTRVGFETSAGRRLYTTCVPFDENSHHVDRLLALADGAHAYGGVRPTPRPRVFPSEDEQRAVDRLLTREGALGQPLVALAPGSIWGTKRWPGYAELAPALSELGRPVVIGSMADADFAQQIVDATGGRAINATGRGFSILESAELIRRSRALVTNDSAPLHLASAMNTPTVAVFGPTVPEFGFGPLADRSYVAGVPSLPCRPCDRHGPMRCPLSHWRCMREITPEQVMEQLRHLVAGH